MEDKLSVITFDVTATHDNPFNITPHDIPFYTANFHCYTNAALYGSQIAQPGTFGVGAVIDFTNGNLHDFFFRNAVGAANTNIVCIATVPTTFVKQQLGLV